MADFYKILKADPLGDPWTPNAPDAKPIQNYWCQVEGQALAVSIGKQVGNSLSAGEHVYGDLMYAKSQKGTEYWKFKSAKVPDGVQRPADSPAQATAQAAVVSDQVPAWATQLMAQVDIMSQMIDEIYTVVVEKRKPMPADFGVKPDETVEQVAGEPIDEVTKATLDDIFGTEPEPEV